MDDCGGFHPLHSADVIRFVSLARPSCPFGSLHAVLLLLLENVLIAAEVGDPRLLAGLFPLPLAAITGFLGAWMAVHLVRDMGIDPLYMW